ncbi:pyruvate kinase [Candidatus Phytoplasma luffae]|uniref:Pyruvate kinase n=1 Tax=Loofah witches'-broom phytoplasma TaxID=35773 RepID=A0A975FJJ9_LOWBP|nr:pyruvate kinase [Candidatus Phytoplasma luffae]QTX03164.1 pyruvate kinase [Candidatus Phytoplasma luffae]
MNKTKMVCTLGPASSNKEILKQLIQSGLCVARFNFTHADYDKSKVLIKNIKDLNKELKKNVGLMLDTKGPEVRTHEFDGLVTIEKDSLVKIYVKEILGNANSFSVTYKDFIKELNVGDMIYVDDGYLTLEVIEKNIQKEELVTKAKNTHVLKSRRGINVPSVNLQIDFISSKDHKDIVFAAKEDYDFIAASFVRNAQDVKDIKQILVENNAEHVKIISKIENQEGINNLEEIIEVSDGIMVARGDLGIEVPGELVPIYQTDMIQQCLEQGKPVIVATQMLESMQRNPRPTKAEISDVFNATKEGATSTMLSGESASGDYPLESVKYMAKINHQAEQYVDYEYYSNFYQPQNIQEELLLKAVEMANCSDIKAIIVDNFEDAYNISKFHPSICVFAKLSDVKEARMLALSFGVIPVLNQEELDEKINNLDNDNKNLLLIKQNKIEIKSL